MTAQSKSNFAFGKDKRLLDAHDYKAVFDQAQWKVSCKELLCLAIPNGSDSARLGLVIAKKNVKLAVQRNRVKRIIRDSFRQQDTLPNIDVVILARAGLGQLNNQELHQLIGTQWQRLVKKAQSKPQKA